MFDLLKATLSSLSIVVASTLIAPSAASAAETDVIKNLLNRYFEVVSKKDMVALEALWAREPGVVLVFPSDKDAAVGWDAVKKSYQARLDMVSEWKLSPVTASDIQVHPSSAVSTTKIRIDAVAKSGASLSYVLLFTQVFVRRGNDWLLVASHGSRVPD